METPAPHSTSLSLRRRGIDLAVWAAVVVAMVAIAAGVAWFLASNRFELRQIPYERAPDEEPREGYAARPSPLPPAAVAPSRTPYSAGRGVHGPRWVARPIPEYPQAALEAGAVEGVVRLSCVADLSNRLSGCRVLSETPSGYGFGASALRAAAESRVTPQTIDGVRSPSTITYTTRYRPPR